MPPELVGDLDPLTNVTATLHSPLTLLCEATGIPPPRVRWFRGEEPISPGEDTYLLAGKGPAKGVSDCWVWPSASVHHMRIISDPELPGLVGITITLLVSKSVPQNTGQEKMDLNKSGKGFLLCSLPGDSQ